MKVNLENYRKKGKRKEKVRIDEWDTFSLDSTLAKIIHPALIRFKKERVRLPGVPTVFFQPGDEMDKNGNPTDASLAIAEKRFMDALDKMIYSMHQIAYEYPEEMVYFPENKKTEKFDINKEGLDAYGKRIQEGCELFGKYFNTLWW
jgi:hypothetical protein